MSKQILIIALIIFKSNFILSQEIHKSDFVGEWVLLDIIIKKDTLENIKNTKLILKEDDTYLYESNSFKTNGYWYIDNNDFVLKESEKNIFAFSPHFPSKNTLILNYSLKFLDPDVYYKLKFFKNNL